MQESTDCRRLSYILQTKSILIMQITQLSSSFVSVMINTKPCTVLFYKTELIELYRLLVIVRTKQYQSNDDNNNYNNNNKHFWGGYILEINVPH